MDNEKFWAELGTISRTRRKKNRSEDDLFLDKQIRAVTLLRQAYRENLDLLCGYLPHPDDPSILAHAFLGDFNDRHLICFTSLEKAKRNSWVLEDHCGVCTFPCRYVLGMLVNKPVITSLVFDPEKGKNPKLVVTRSFFNGFNTTGEPPYPDPDDMPEYAQ